MFVFPPCFNVGDTIYFPFDTYDSNGASITITGLAITDIEVYKDGSVTQRVSDNGYVLLDTDGIDFDGSVGLHGFSIDTSDNSDAGFWVDGTQVWVHVNAITVDTRTVRFTYYLPLGFSLRPTTLGNTLDVTATGTAGINWGNIENKTTANDLSGTDIQLCDTVTTLTGHTAQTADHTAAIADVPTVAEFNARTLVAASYFDPTADTVANVTAVATLTGHTAQTADHTAGIADIPTVAEFNARTILAASYFDPAVDTVVNVTNVATLTTYTGNTLQTADVATLITTVGVAGAGLGDLGGMSTAMKAEVQAEADASLVSIHLNQFFAADYDPATPPGVATAWANELVESIAGVTGFTTVAMSNAPSATGTGLTPLTKGTAQAGGGNQEIILAAVTNIADLVGAVVNLVGGTGAGQHRLITAWVQGTDTATVHKIWDTNPDATTTYEVVQGASDTWLIEGIDATTQLIAAANAATPTVTLDGTNLAVAPTLSIPRNDDFSQQITTTIDATGWQIIWITSKDLGDFKNDLDSDSFWQLKAIASPSSSSLTFINKQAPAGGETGTLTISSDNPLVMTPTLDVVATKALLAAKRKYQIKWMDAAGNVRRLTTIGNVVTEDTVTAAVT